MGVENVSGNLTSLQNLTNVAKLTARLNQK